jgi:long-chain acyl-CoA synthetase
MTRDDALARLTAPGEPWELVDVVQHDRRCRAFRNAPSTLRGLFEEACSDLPFLVFEEERSSFEEAWVDAARLAHLLVEDCGVQKGDRVAIAMRNYPEWVTAFMAATSIGAVAVAMNALWTSEEMGWALRDCSPRALICDGERMARLAKCEDLPARLRVFSVRSHEPQPAGGERLEEALVRFRRAREMPEVDVAPDDDATLFYTSGSTGHPKGAVSCHRAVVSALMSWELDARAGLLVQGVEPPPPVDEDNQGATLLAVPLFHVTGCHAVFLASFRTRRRLVSMYKWDVEEAATLIEEERITSLVAPSAMTGDLVAWARREGRDLSSLLVVGGGGAARAPEQVRSIAGTFAQALPNTGWGMTETNAIGTGIGGQDYLDHPESSGRASVVLDLRVVDDAGTPLPAGERGELQVHGTSVIRGYWNRPEANAETFTEEGWLRTGDVAVIDEDGYLYIVDRIKDLVIRGGENIGCGAVEAAILEYPGVLEVSVYGVPDERLGEEVGATIHAEKAIEPDALRDFLTRHLARFEIPRYLHFSDEPLPRTASGKILKRQLRDEAAARAG